MAAYVDSTGVTNLTADIKALADETYVNSVAYNSTTGMITKTIGTTTTNVIGIATASVDGLMSSADKMKLDATLEFTFVRKI